MRRAPNAHSHIVQTIPPNAQIDLEHCSGGWCYASWRNLFGYIPAFAVAEAGPPPMVPLPPPIRVTAPPSVVAPALDGADLCRRLLGLRPLVGAGLSVRPTALPLGSAYSIVAPKSGDETRDRKPRGRENSRHRPHRLSRRRQDDALNPSSASRTAVRYAVVVNEFGEIGIDNELIIGADEECSR
jgi:hypothetical protein